MRVRAAIGAALAEGAVGVAAEPGPAGRFLVRFAP
jgi:hypothetical protein